jgi:hypothetical protein
MTATTPLRCANSAMAFDVTTSTIVLLDTGNYPSYSSFLNQTWTFSGSGTPNWTNTSASLINANGPLPGRINQVIAFDGTNIMLYGGQGSSSTAGVYQDTWLWNGTTWTQQSPTVAPFGRYKAQACYLAGAGAVMFGGEIVGQLLLETWVWSGSTWSQISVPNGVGPSARTGHAMAANTTQVIMFGGRLSNSQNNHTWSYTTAGGWTQLFPTVSPSIRSEHCLAYDSTNSVFVLFGGQNEYGYLNETWTYSVSGNTWTQVAVPNGSGPGGVINAQMAFDTVSHRTILYGGISAITNYPSNQTWSFNASSGVWTQL